MGKAGTGSPVLTNEHNHLLKCTFLVIHIPTLKKELIKEASSDMFQVLHSPDTTLLNSDKHLKSLII